MLTAALIHVIDRAIMVSDRLAPRIYLTTPSSLPARAASVVIVIDLWTEFMTSFSFHLGLEVEQQMRPCACALNLSQGAFREGVAYQSAGRQASILPRWTGRDVIDPCDRKIAGPSPGSQSKAGQGGGSDAKNRPCASDYDRSDQAMTPDLWGMFQ